MRYYIEGTLPNMALSSNARRGKSSHYMIQKRETEEEYGRAYQLLLIATAQGLPPFPWAVTWVAHYPTKRVPDVDNIPVALKAWLDALVDIAKGKDSWNYVRRITYSIVPGSTIGPGMDLYVEPL